MGDAISDLKEILLKQKNAQIKDFVDKITTKSKIEPVNLKEKEAAEKSEFKVKTNTVLDDIIGGGIPEGKSALLYGEFAAGKTQTCETATVLTAGHVIYIDVEDSCRMERLKEMCETRGINWEAVRDKIIYFNPQDWMEQMLVAFNSLPAPIDVDGKVDLIICDSLNKHFRGIEFQGRENLGLKTGMLREFIYQLERAAKSHHAALLYTSQVYDEPNAGAYTSKSDTQKPIGGHSLEHQPDFVLFFMKSTGNVRICRMIDSSYNKLAERSFVITEKGIEDIPENAELAKRLLDSAAKYDAKMSQEEKIKGKKPKDDKDVATKEQEVKEIAEILGITAEPVPEEAQE
jgi:DNA repair protein RadB